VSTPLQRAVEIMDRLRSPGGCPWDAEQTHASLAKYLVEETYEVLDAIESGDEALLREELGDLLLQVLFHARLAEELPPELAFSIDDVATDLADKLVRRHPHVFDRADGDPQVDSHQLNETWERQKVSEKGRTSATDGVPLGQPALALSAKLVSRARRAELDIPVPGGDDIGDRLLALVQESVAAGVDPESALRVSARRYRQAMLDAEGTT
jgi:XTP/dITP diphosphohydrolase